MASFITPGFKLVQVLDSPKTWIEVPQDATEEYIKDRVDKFYARQESQKRSELRKAARLFSKEPKPRYINYSGPIYHIPEVTPKAVNY